MRKQDQKRSASNARRLEQRIVRRKKRDVKMEQARRIIDEELARRPNERFGVVNRLKRLGLSRDDLVRAGIARLEERPRSREQELAVLAALLNLR